MEEEETLAAPTVDPDYFAAQRETQKAYHRLECLKMAQAAPDAHNHRDVLKIAESFADWVEGNVKLPATSNG
jgi:hypothetical protein